METEFIFEGKKYISAKRASELYGYNSDYIGQLCRGGLIDGRMLGRSWFVLEDALIAHKELAPKKPRGRLPRNFVPLKEAAALTGYTTDHISYLCRNSLVECRMVHEKWFVAQESIVSYRAESEQKQKERADALKHEAVLAQQHAGETTHSEPPVETPEIKIPTFAYSRAQKIMFAAVLVVVMCAASFMVPSVRQFAAVAMSNSRASVAEVFLAIENSLRGAYRNLSFVSKNAEQQVASGPDFFGNGTRAGIAVVPSTNNAAKDEQVKEYIKSSFSDETRVVPDDTGVSGVIKPVFKKQSEQDYLYVMVPVKN